MSSQQGTYALVLDCEQNLEKDQIINKHPSTSRNSVRAFAPLACILCLLSITIILAFVFNLVPKYEIPVKPIMSSSCIKPSTRREWRTLHDWEKKDYIEAVQCLASSPSVLTDEGSNYDDFDLTHEIIGQNSHIAASFLPWHRYFLHVYEKYLMEKCDYRGIMPYWDWTLDWQDLAKSSIWSNTTGFGGGGDPNGPIGIAEGRCVSDGPFSDLVLHYYNSTVNPHCLSRTFANLDTVSGLVFQPEAIGRVQRAGDYELFVDQVENLGHNAMHWAIKGDFSKFSAPNDPVFYLHHTQLDRLWYLWQLEQPGKRFLEYEGISFRNSTQPGSLDDSLSSNGLAPEVLVSDVMRTDSGYICYRY